MTLPAPSDLQYALIEFIAHVNAEVNKSISMHIYIHIHTYTYAKKDFCILDWGIPPPVPSDMQYALIKCIAHMNA